MNGSFLEQLCGQRTATFDCGRRRPGDSRQRLRFADIPEGPLGGIQRCLGEGPGKRGAEVLLSSR